MQTTKFNRNYQPAASRRLFVVLGIAVSLASLSLAGCAQSNPQTPTSNGKPGANAPHEERNPSQHPEQFRQ